MVITAIFSFKRRILHDHLISEFSELGRAADFLELMSIITLQW